MFIARDNEALLRSEGLHPGFSEATAEETLHTADAIDPEWGMDVFIEGDRDLDLVFCAT